MFNKYFGPFYEEDDGLNIGGGNEEQVATVPDNLDEGQSEEDNSGIADQKPVQSQEDNAKYAAARREAQREKQALIDENEQIAKDLGYESHAEFKAEMLKRKHETERQSYIDTHGIDPDAVKPLVEKLLQEHPLYKELEANKAKSKIDTAIIELNSAFPDLNIKNGEDLDNLPNSQDITQLIRQGNSLVNAYKLANFDELINKQSAAAKQAAINQVNGKAHIKPNGQGADIDTGPMPDEETLRMYRRMNPGKTDEFYIAHYRKSLKE